MAHGRLEQSSGGDKNPTFHLIEMNSKNCLKTSCTSQLNQHHRNENTTAFWMVEKIRHRDPGRGHQYEMKITVFPVKRNKFENKRETNSEPHGHPKIRSFLLRDKDYPKYFPQYLEQTNNIEKRTFEMFGITQPGYNDFRIPFNLEFNDAKDNAHELNTGEYYVGGGGDLIDGSTSTTSASYYQKRPFPTAVQYTPPTTFGTLQYNQINRPNHIKFPANNDDPPNEYYEPLTTPLTATHLHHHYYLNKNNVPLIKATSIEKENIFDGPKNAPFRINVDPINQQQFHGPIASNLVGPPAKQLVQNNYSAGIYGGLPLNYPLENNRQPSGYQLIGGKVNFPEPLNYQTAFSLPDQLPVPPSGPQSNGNLYQFPTQFQLATPPRQIDNQPNGPFTTAAYSFGGLLSQQHPNQQLFTAHIDLNPRYIQQQIISSPGAPIRFHGNEKYENNQFSEPDPIYQQHQQQQHSDNSDTPPNYQVFSTIGPAENLDIVDSIKQYPEILSTRPNKYLPKNSLNAGKLFFPSPSPVIINNSDHKNNENSAPELTAPDYNDEQLDGKQNKTNYPDSINAQLPPPEQGDDTNVPYVESSIVTQTIKQNPHLRQRPRPPSTYTTEKIPDSSRETTIVPINETELIISTVLTPITTIRPRLQRPRGYYQMKITSTEKPVLKWMPKRNKPKLKATSEINESIETTTTSMPCSTTITTTIAQNITPINNENEIIEPPRTSISTSISIKVGDGTERNLANTPRRNKTRIFSMRPPFDRQNKLKYNGFLPTVLPTNVQLTKSNLTTIATNTSTITLFRTEENGDGKTNNNKDLLNEAEESELTQSILKHAKRVN